MSDAFIDEDLNYTVEIDVKAFGNPKSQKVKKAYRSGMDKFFNTVEEFCSFMSEVGKNHPEGVNFRYLVNLMSYYSTSQALLNLEDKGMIVSSMNDEGEIIYSLTELGQKVTDHLD